MMAVRLTSIAFGAAFGIAASFVDAPVNGCALGLCSVLCCMMAMSGLRGDHV